MEAKSIEEQLEEATARIEAQEKLVAKLVEILVGRGTLAPGHKKILEKSTRSRAASTLQEIHLGSAEDKYTVAGAEIDCAPRLHLCGARCCKLNAPLGQQDLDEGKLEWEARRPYIIKRAEDDYCNYLDDAGGCGCYDIRPTVCRKFDCREDRRIWQDFDKMIPTPDVFIRLYEPPAGDEPLADDPKADD